jgi:hypothetical protein
MKLPAGIAPAVGMVAGGRRLAVLCSQLGDGVGGAWVVGVGVSSADIASRSS